MDQLTLFAGEVPANPSASPEDERAWTASLASCSSISALCRSFILGGTSGKTYPEYSTRRMMPSDASSTKWTKAGIRQHGECLMLNSSEWPNDAGEFGLSARVAMLSEILQRDAPQRFYLSARACEGILARARRRGRDLPPILEEALEAVIRSSSGTPAATSPQERGGSDR